MARAGERTRILVSDSPLDHVRFRASCLTGEPTGRIEIETVHGMRSMILQADNRVETGGLVQMSVVPEADTAITFVPADRPVNPALALGGALVVLGGLAWTAWEAVGG